MNINRVEVRRIDFLSDTLKLEFSTLKMKILNFFALTHSIFSQASHENDLQLWSKFKIEKKISKKENLNIFYGHRLRENITIKSKALYDFNIREASKNKYQTWIQKFK